MAAKKHERFIETSDILGNTHFQISVYYNLGGMNYFNYRNEARGFYLSVTPVKKEGGFITTAAFSGIKMLIHTANRFSDKQLNLAIEKSAVHEQELIDAVKAQHKKSA